MILGALGLLAVGGLAYGLFKSGGGKSADGKRQIPIITKADEIKSVNREFEGGLNCASVRVFDSPDYETTYRINGKEYDNRYIPDEKWTKLEKPEGIKCDSVLLLKKDRYGNKVIKLVKEIPCFDSGDREYDSCHSLKFFYSDKKVHALYCGEGYRIAKLVLFENITHLSENLKGVLRENGFPFLP